MSFLRELGEGLPAISSYPYFPRELWTFIRVLGNQGDSFARSNAWETEKNYTSLLTCLSTQNFSAEIGFLLI